MTNLTPRAPISYAAGLALVSCLTACGGAAGEPTAPSTTAPGAPSSSQPGSSSNPSSSAPSAAGVRTLHVTVTGTKVAPAPSTVSIAVGEQLTLTVTADHHDELHIHGFDVEAPLEAGTPTSVTLTGKQPGVYEVETHHPELRLLKIAVR